MLPDGINLARVWCPTKVANLRKMAAEGTSVWRRGEDLTFVHRSRATELTLLPAIQLPMWRIEDDLWALSVRIRDLDQAAISYAFVPSGEAWPATETWRGPLAPPAPRRAGPLAGQLTEAVIKSRWLNESRRLTVYVPPGPETPPYVLFMTDGQTMGTFAAVVEPLMVDLTVPRTVLVGVHSSGSTTGEGWRSQEYIPGYDGTRFEAHRRFFIEEVPAWAERELGVSAEPARRAIAGYSNGAVLASALGCRHPDRVGRVIAFSPGVQPPLHRDSRPAPHYL